VTRPLLRAAALPLALLSGCGLENWFGNVGHTPYLRPAAAIRGAATWTVGSTSYQLASLSQLTVTDGAGNAVTPFSASLQGGAYELKLPSSDYEMLMVRARVGNASVRALVPSVAKESTAGGVDLDARNLTEALIVEGRLSYLGAVAGKPFNFKRLTPATYLATRAKIRADMDDASKPTHTLLGMVERILGTWLDPSSGSIDPDFFAEPALNASYGVTDSPLSASWILRNRPDYATPGVPESDSSKFDAALAAAVQLYKPEGCPDPDHMRLVFTVDFNQGALNGNGGAIDRFKWAKDKPGKSMFFVGWIYTRPGIPSSEITSSDPDASIAAAARQLEKDLGSSTPNTIAMYDDGTNGDEVAGDGIWTVVFTVPTVPGKLLRLGYKYTWGTFGAVWTGSEEWPGNARILEVVDVNGDGLVYRRDVFGDEATNKDYQNLSLSPANTGSITWTTDLRGCGAESHEQKVTLHNAQRCDQWITPASVAPLTVACP
jgi:hypothetical protein